MLLNRSCPVCRTPARTICEACRRRLAATPADPLAIQAIAHQVGVDRLTALWDYGPISRAVVLALKNRSRSDLARVLAPALARQAAGEAEVVGWIPASGWGRRRRGYDQSELLAKRVAGHLGLPARRLLHRTDCVGGRSRSRDQRLGGPVLVERRPPGPPLGRVLLIDDVVTTGGSLAAAVAVLQASGVTVVDAAVLAVVNDKGRTSPNGRSPVEVAVP